MADTEMEFMDSFFAEIARESDTSLEFAKTFHKTPALVSYRVRCGKANCRCMRGELHGPYWFLRWRFGTHQRRRYVKAEELDAVREVIAMRQHDDRIYRMTVQRALGKLRELKQWLREIEQNRVQ